MAEYIWLGGSETVMGGFDIRSKTRTLEKKPTSPSELPVWNYDGSSTEQAPGADSEVLPGNCTGCLQSNCRWDLNL